MPPPAIIRVPQEDLKPLYDAVEDCQACQAKLTAAQGDLSDERTKFAAATAERDAAIPAARGTFWTRTRTAAKWIDHRSRRRRGAVALPLGSGPIERAINLTTSVLYGILC